MRLAVSSDPIDPRAVESDVRAPGYGGVVTFLGTVRQRSADGREIDALDYEAYGEMAVTEMQAIAREVRERFGDVRLAMVHRTGEVEAGGVAVVVAAAAVHRREAFEACSYAIDALKSRAPIWKKERYAGGTSRWLTNGCDGSDESDATCR